MIHFARLMEIYTELRELQIELNMGLARGEFTERRYEIERNISVLKEEQTRLEAEAEEYREGYEAGRDFHMDGVSMKDEWLGRFGFFRQGFDAAGQDS